MPHYLNLRLIPVGAILCVLLIIAAREAARADSFVPRSWPERPGQCLQVGGVTLRGDVEQDPASGVLHFSFLLLELHDAAGEPVSLIVDPGDSDHFELHAPLSLTVKDRATVLLADGTGLLFEISLPDARLRGTEQGDKVSLPECLRGRLIPEGIKRAPDAGPIAQDSADGFDDQTVLDIAWAGADQLVVLRPWSIQCLNWSQGSPLWEDSHESLLATDAYFIPGAVHSSWHFALGQVGFEPKLILQNGLIIVIGDGRLSYLDPSTGGQRCSVAFYPVVDTWTASADGQGLYVFGSEGHRAENLYTICPSRGIYTCRVVSTLKDVVGLMPSIEPTSRARILGWWANRLATFPVVEDQ